MKRSLLLLSFLFVLLLAACAVGTPTALAPTETSSPEPADAATPVAFEASGPATCTVVSNALPTPNPTLESLFPPLTEEDWAQGAETPRITFLEYSDLQCPYCSELEPILVQLAEDYPEDVSIAFRHYPLNSIHPNAALAAQAAEAAGLQAEEKFFEVKNYLFEQQAVWSALTIEEFETYLLEEVAVEFDLDPEQLADDMTSDELVEKIEAAAAYGNTIGIPGTPFLLINGQPYQGPRDYASLESIVQMIQLEDRQFNECPEMEIEQGGQYQATIVTEKGNIVIDLFSQQAPFTVNSFIFLAENGWFDNVPFHRVLPGFVAQAGDPSGTGYGTPGYHFSNEVDPSLRFDKPGVVGMANSGETSNGSQFFITYAPVPELDGGYTVFGQVVEGMDVVEALQERNPSGGGELPEADVIETILIKEL